MTTVIYNTEQLRAIKNGIKHATKIDPTYQYPWNMSPFWHFFLRKMFIIVEIIKQCITNVLIDAYFELQYKEFKLQ